MDELSCQFEEAGIAPGQHTRLAGVDIICTCGYVFQQIELRGIYAGHQEAPQGKMDIVHLLYKPLVCLACEKRTTVVGFPCGPSGQYRIELPLFIQLPVTEGIER